MSRAALGVCTHLGWATVSAVRVGKDGVEAVRTFRLATCDPEDREAREPYHVAGGFDGLARVPRPREPRKVIASGLRKQRRRTARNLERLLRELADWRVPVRRAALFVGRGRSAPDLERILASHAQIHVAEGDAVREAVRRACDVLDLRVVEIDRRRLPEEARSRLALDERATTRHLKALRPEAGGAWRKEERECALAAWIAAAAPPGRLREPGQGAGGRCG